MVGFLQLSHHSIPEGKYSVDLVAVDLLQQLSERPQVFLSFLEQPIELISFLMESAPGLRLRGILQQPLQRLLDVQVDGDICEGLRGLVVRADDRCLGLLLGGGEAVCADGVRAGQAERDVVMRVEPLGAEGAPEVLQVVDVHLNEYIE